MPDRGPAGAFVDDTGDGKKYADEIETKLTGLIASPELASGAAPLLAAHR